MSKSRKEKAVMQRSKIMGIAIAGLLTATVASGESYEGALEGAKRESLHQGENAKDPRREALEEAERESPHQGENAADPRRKALEEAERESPHQGENAEDPRRKALEEAERERP